MSDIYSNVKKLIFIINIVLGVTAWATIMSSKVMAESSSSLMSSLSKLQKIVSDPSERHKAIKWYLEASEKERSELNNLMQNEIDTLSLTLPKKISNNVTFIGAMMSGNSIVYHYLWAVETVDAEVKGIIISEMGNHLKKGFGNSPYAAYLVFGFSWTYNYYSEDGTYIGTIIIDDVYCGIDQ